jgi:hypothetical protein
VVADAKAAEAHAAATATLGELVPKYLEAYGDEMRVNSGGKLVKNQRLENGHCVGGARQVGPSGSSLPACSPP